MCSWGEGHLGRRLSHPIMPRVQLYTTQGCCCQPTSGWPGECWSGFPTGRLLCHLLSFHTLWKRVIKCSPHFWSGELCSISWSRGVATQIICNILPSYLILTLLYTFITTWIFYFLFLGCLFPACLPPLECGLHNLAALPVLLSTGTPASSPGPGTQRLFNK